MKKSKFEALNWNTKWKLDSMWKWSLKKEDILSNLPGYSAETVRWRTTLVKNDVAVYIKDGVYSLRNLSYMFVSNKKTNGVLSCNGYTSFGEYITDVFLDNFTNQQLDENSFALKNYSDDAWKTKFFEELNKYLIEVDKKITKKNKKDMVKDKIQSIEGDLDYAIQDFAEAHKEQGIVLQKEDQVIASATVEYVIKKEIDGFYGFWGPCVRIRKMKTGNYTCKLIGYNGYKWGQDDMAYFEFKKELTPEELNELLDGYFKPFYTVDAALYPSWHGHIDKFKK